MTDRGEDALIRDRHTLRIGPSQMHWTGTELIIDVNEVSSLPLVSRMRGQIRVAPTALTSVELPMTDDGAHVWRPFGPTCTITVDLEAKGWQWTGHGYFDANFGLRPLEADFSYWTWARFPTDTGSLCAYDLVRRDGTALSATFAFAKDGTASSGPDIPMLPMNRSFWLVRREAPADSDTRAKQTLSMLDAPFYTRSVVTTNIDGKALTGVHESLDLERYALPWLKPMLALRVPRRRRWFRNRVNGLFKKE